MSRRRAGPNGIMGPTSALTSFLREHGITAQTTFRRVEHNTTPQASPSRTNAEAPASSASSNEIEGDAISAPSRRPRESGYASDNLDESEDEKRNGAPPKKKQRLTKAAAAKLKEKQKAERKKQGIDSDSNGGDSDDPYTAPSKGPGIMNKAISFDDRPGNGSRFVCPECDKGFTVTKYTVAGDAGGWLCFACAKALGKDLKATVRKRKPAQKRHIVHFEQAEPVKTLTNMCINVIGEYIDDVEALGDIGSVNMDHICKIVSKSRRLNAGNVQLFYDAAATQLAIYDSTNLPPDAYQVMANLNPRLERLHLHCCGRMDSSVLQYWAKPTTFRSLARLELFAPYLVRTEAWQTFLTSKGPQLTGFLITNSPRFDEACMLALVQNCTKLEELKLSEIGKLNDSWLEYIYRLTLLRSLSLTRPAESLTDQPVVELLGKIGAQLEHLDLSGNEELTDVLLRDGIGKNCTSLQSLALSGVTQLTDGGVAAFFKQWKQDEGMSYEVNNTEDCMDVDRPVTNRPLSSVDLSQISELGTDALLALLLHSGPGLLKLSINGWKSTAEKALGVIAQSAPKLEDLDVGWCREVDNFVVGKLLGMGQKDEDRRSAGCVNLKVLRLYGCNRVTNACPTRRGVVILGVESDVHVNAR